MTPKQAVLAAFPDAILVGTLPTTGPHRYEMHARIFSERWAIEIGGDALIGESTTIPSAWAAAFSRMQNITRMRYRMDSGILRRSSMEQLVRAVRFLGDPLDAQLQADLLRVLHRHGISVIYPEDD